MENNRPLYGLQAVTDLLDIEAGFIRTLELEGLLEPLYSGGARYFSLDHLNWLSCLRYMVQDMGIGISGLKQLLKRVPCWQISGCRCETRQRCPSRQMSRAAGGRAAGQSAQPQICMKSSASDAAAASRNQAVQFHA